ncbi:hypothetical protein ABZT43_17700, partial [Streptomyces sp. NPDC005349]|uniref:hypothetical protein n=1 Tax=Streptomyces sp. NPDC005349 TaxID=3157037 RepID=UPI0033B98147
MLPPELPPLPALTRAECELLDRYLEVVDLLGRINPARSDHTYGGLRAAQALVGRATALTGIRAGEHAEVLRPAPRLIPPPVVRDAPIG